MPWTAEQDATMLKMLKDGHPYSAIAERIGGVTRNACIGRARRIGVTPMTRAQAVDKQRRVAATRSKRAQSERGRDYFAKGRAALAKQRPRTSVGKAPATPRAAAARPTNSVPNAKGYSLMDLPKDGCRYIANDPRHDPAPFCGQPQQSGSSYCDHHHGVCHSGPVPSRPRQPSPTAVHAPGRAADVSEIMMLA